MYLIPTNIKMSLILMCFMLTGCSLTFNVPLEFEKPVTRPEGVDTVPVTMGVYYSPVFLAYEQSVTIGGGHKLKFPIGKSSADYFAKMLPMIFERVHIVDERPPVSKSAPAFDAVLEPLIEKVVIQDPGLVGWIGKYDVQITYRFILYSQDGEPLASWTVSGAGTNTKNVSWTGVDKNFLAAEAAVRAFEDAGQQFMKGFANEPEVHRWLRQRELTSFLSPGKIGFRAGAGDLR